MITLTKDGKVTELDLIRILKDMHERGLIILDLKERTVKLMEVKGK